ncbi:MAG: alpha/beta hydrolase [Oscillospiraceae bacterium]|nr:alpha/beta hydrolase [Oscillospiraceae bacterium]
MKHKQLKVIKVIVVILLTMLLIASLLVAALGLVYPAVLRARHRIDTPNGIDRMEVVTIGGVDQALYFRGQDVENPVILVIHGGPAYPTMPLLHTFQFPWEYYFTIVHWDQRNAGRTFFLNDPAEVFETLSFERIVQDAYEVTHHVREVLGKDQIAIMGYSWGSAIGTALVQTHPQYFNGYIAVGQTIDRNLARPVAFSALLQAAQESGNSRHIAQIEALEPWAIYFDNSLTGQIRQWQARYGQANTGSDLRSILDIMMSPYYQFQHKTYFMRNFQRWSTPLTLRYFNARDFGVEYSVPVFYIHGVRDFQTPYPVARDFFDEIIAPHKAFFSIPDASHDVFRENNEELTRVLIEEIRPTLVGTS